jgi:hypothetical protein
LWRLELLSGQSSHSLLMYIVEYTYSYCIFQDRLKSYNSIESPSTVSPSPGARKRLASRPCWRV